MTNLVERYVHQVGQYLPPKERADIEAELHSQIQDELDDRYGGEDTEENIITILNDLGHPYKISASYNTDRYLIGPMLYPFMLMILRQGWLIIPSIVIFLNLFGVLISTQESDLLAVFLDLLFNSVQATLLFTAVVIFVFAIIERINLDSKDEEIEFNPADLSEVNDPRVVDRSETILGIVMSSFVFVILLYFLRVGGLTLQFSLGETVDVIPVPMLWLTLLIINLIMMTLLHVWVLRRNRWGFVIWLIETILEVFGVICLYFVFYIPIFETFLILTFPNIPFINNGAEIVAIITAVGTLITRGSKSVKLWGYRNNQIPSFNS